MYEALSRQKEEATSAAERERLAASPPPALRAPLRAPLRAAASSAAFSRAASAAALRARKLSVFALLYEEKRVK